MTCLRDKTLKFYSLFLTSSNLPFNTETTKKLPAEKKLRRIYVCTPSLHEVLLVNSSTFIIEHNSSFMIRIITGDWTSCELSSFVISMWDNHRWAERIKNRKEEWPRECPITKKGECRSISAKPTGIKKEKDIPACLKTRRNCIETLDFSMSIDIIMLHSYFNAFTCSWYASNTYHSPVNLHINSTCCIRSTPMHWSRLGQNCYGTDTYLHSSYPRLEVNICSVRVPSLPIWWRQ